MAKWGLGFLFLLLSLGAPATTLYVNHAATGSNTGESWANAFPTLQAALAAAVSDDEIWVAAGTYYPDEGGTATNNDRTSTFSLKDGVAIYGGFASGETQLNQRNVATHVTTLSGDIDGTPRDNSGNAIHVVSSSNNNNTAILDGFTISGGNADGIIYPNNVGGGVYNLQSNPSFTNSIIWNNRDQTGIGTANSAVFNSSANPSFSYSLVQGLNPGGTGNLTGTTTNPQFAMPLTPGLNTGGDYRLQSTSPARDVGNKDVNMLTTDLDGNQRIIGTQIDLGAYEFRPLGDISGDGVVDQNDSTALISVYGLTPSSPNWNPAADLNGDGRINMLDYRLLRRALAAP